LGRGAWGVGRDGAVVDDAAAAGGLALHHAEGVLRAEEHAGQIDVDDGLPLLEREVLQRERRCAAAGGVEQQVDPAELRDRGIEQCLDRGGTGDVGRHGERARGERTGSGEGLLQGVRAAAGEDDGPAVLEQCERDGAADA